MAISGAEVRERDLRRRFTRSQIPERYRGMSLELLERTDDNTEAFTVIERYMQDLRTNPRTPQGLLLLGPPGRGKTSMVCCLGQWILNHGGDVFYTSVAQWQKTMLRTFRRDDDAAVEDAYRTLDLIERTRFLILDDAGKEHVTDSRHVEDELDALLRKRYDDGHPTFVTSNTRIKDWGARYSPAMESFIHEAFVIVAVGGPDWRKRTRGEG